MKPTSVAQHGTSALAIPAVDPDRAARLEDRAEQALTALGARVVGARE